MRAPYREPEPVVPGATSYRARTAGETLLIVVTLVAIAVGTFYAFTLREEHMRQRDADRLLGTSGSYTEAVEWCKAEQKTKHPRIDNHYCY